VLAALPLLVVLGAAAFLRFWQLDAVGFNGDEAVYTAAGCHERATSDLVETMQPKSVLALGDFQYVRGTAANYAAS
jgi:hypothetical protein